MHKIFVVLGLLLAINSLAQSPSSKPLTWGHTDVIESKILAEKRTLHIYLPEGYKPNDTLRYPVIYLLDGAVDEDFLPTIGLVQYNSFSWIHRMPQSIVVGIVNTDRKRDFTFPSQVATEKKRYPSSGGADQFIGFLAKELQPYIAKNYRVQSDRTLIGQSLGGLLATRVLMTQPALFNRYIIISPSLWWNDGSLLRETPRALKEALKTPIDIYIGVGKEGVYASTPTTPHVMEVDANVLADQIRSCQNKKVQVFFDYLPQEDHSSTSVPALFNALRLLYPQKK